MECCTTRLIARSTPVSLMEDPTASAMDPARSYPNGTGAWWAHPLSSYPNVSAAVPTLVSADPDISGPWRSSYHSRLDGRRWRNPNHCLSNAEHSSQQK